MAQRLALASAVLRPAPLVLLDEPYAALDAQGVAWVDDWLDRLRASGTTVVVATHEITARGGAGSRVVTLRAGRLASDPGPRPAPVPASIAATDARDRDWQRARAVAWNDLRTERRAPAALGAMVFFGALVLFLFGIALGADVPLLQRAAPGLGWVTVLLASLLTLDRGGWDGLRLAPGARWPIYAGKVMATTLLLVVLELLLLPAAALFYNLSLPSWPAVGQLVATALLSTIGIAAVGTLYGALTTNIRARQVLLPLLLFPLMVPVVLAAVKITTLTLSGDPVGELAGWTKLLVAADLLYVTTGLLTFGAVLDE
jgi:heme exporter protein B